MAIIIPITVFLLFFLFKRRLGSPSLASIAGALIYNLFIEDITHLTSSFMTSIPVSYIQFFALCFLILLLPFILYLRQPHSHSTGLLYIIKCLSLTSFIFILLAPQLQLFLPFDQISTNILHTITPFYKLIMLICSIFAYIDILFSQKEV